MPADAPHRPALRREAAIPLGAVVWHGGRPLSVFRVYGSDAAAPVILEELTDSRRALRGQYCLWSVSAVGALIAQGRPSSILEGAFR